MYDLYLACWLVVSPSKNTASHYLFLHACERTTRPALQRQEYFLHWPVS